jgi:hypothetical protein
MLTVESYAGCGGILSVFLVNSRIGFDTLELKDFPNILSSFRKCKKRIFLLLMHSFCGEASCY